MDKKLQYELSLKDLLTGKMAKAVSQTEKMDRVMDSVGSKLARFGAGLGIAAFGKSILDTGVQFDSFQMRLKTLLGSAEAAGAVFNQIKKDAATTPFDVASLTEANALLISAGISAGDARKDVLNLGNAIAASGGGANELSRMAVNLQQIKNLGKATALDIKQFAFAGIPIYQLLAKTTGKTVAQVREMDVSYELLTKSLGKAAEKGGMFYGALADQSKTVGGAISNLKDKFSFLLYDLYNKLKPAITFMINLFSKMIDVAYKFAPVIKILTTLIAAYVIQTKIGAITSFNFALAQRAMAMGMSRSAVATGFLSRGIRGIGAAIKAVPIIGWIAAIAEGISYLWDNFEGFRSLVYGTIESISSLGSNLVLMFKASWYQIKGFLTGDKGLQDLGANLYKQVMANQVSAAATGMKKGKKKDDLAGTGMELAGSFSSKSLNEPSAAGTSGGTGVDISSARPQNININIQNLVKEMNINTTNLQESSRKVKEELSKAILEASNDFNAMAKNG